MKTKLTKWGNSYAIRVPKQIVDDLELSEDSELSLHLRENGFVATKTSKEERLRELLKNVQPQPATDWGPARGKEVW